LKKVYKKEGHTKRSASKSGKEGDKYVTSGYQVQRGCKGVFLSRKIRECVHLWNRLKKVVSGIEHLCVRYLDSALLRRLNLAKDNGQWKTVTEQNASLFAAIALAKNYHSPAHTDLDFFLSVFFCHVDGDCCEYSMDAMIAHYFMFPQYGISIAIRPVDYLLFNPLHYHCCSVKCREYVNDDVFVSSL
jgi:hypothetical protein